MRRRRKRTLLLNCNETCPFYETNECTYTNKKRNATNADEQKLFYFFLIPCLSRDVSSPPYYQLQLRYVIIIR